MGSTLRNWVRLCRFVACDLRPRLDKSSNAAACAPRRAWYCSGSVFLYAAWVWGRDCWFENSRPRAGPSSQRTHARCLRSWVVCFGAGLGCVVERRGWKGLVMKLPQSAALIVIDMQEAFLDS